MVWRRRTAGSITNRTGAEIARVLERLWARSMTARFTTDLTMSNFEGKHAVIDRAHSRPGEGDSINAVRPRAAVLYHYFYPDDVVSARHFADLAEGLRDRGWDVEVWTSNRACRDESVCYAPREVWRGIEIHRIWKPRFKSGSSIGRAISVVWMIAPWTIVEPDRPGAPDPCIRSNMFGNARLGLLYSGNFGRAHSHEAFFELARTLKADGIGFAFGIRGNRAAAVRDSIGPDDHNIRLLGFASEDELESRLSAADIHLVS